MAVSNATDTPLKRSGRWQMRLKSIRQQIDSFWTKFSLKYSQLLLKYAWIILCLSVFLSLTLTGYSIFAMKIRSFDQNDFIIRNGPSVRNAQRLREIFGKDTEYRAHQHIELYPGLDIIIRKRNVSDHSSGNMLKEEIIHEVRQLNEIIHSILYKDTKDSRQYNYSTLCSRVEGNCIVDGNFIFSDKFARSMSTLELPQHGYFLGDDGSNGILDFMFGKNTLLKNHTLIVEDYKDEEELEEEDLVTSTPKSIEVLSHVPLFRLRYSLNSSNSEMNRLSIGWEREAFRHLTERYRSDIIEISVSTSTAIADSIMEKARQEGIFMLLMILVFFILTFMSISIQGNRLTSVGLLPLFGIFNIILSTGATFGLLTLLRVDIIEPMAFLIIIITVIDSTRCSVICGEYHRVIENYLINAQNLPDQIQLVEILPTILESTEPYFLISTSIIGSAYLIFIFFSPIPATISIGCCLFTYILVNYLVHSTFFCSALVITLRRISSRRHCLSCLRLPSTYDVKIISNQTRFEQFYKQYETFFKLGSIYKTFIAPVLCLFSVVCLIFSIWFAFSIDTRLFVDDILPRDAISIRAHMQSQIDDFHIGPIVSFTIPEEIDYKDKDVRSSMLRLLQQCHNEPRINRFKLFWLDYNGVDEITSITDPQSGTEYISPFSRNDLILQKDGNHSKIVASRFFCQYNSILGDREDIRTMHNLYLNAKSSLIQSIFPYSLIFPNYESLDQIRIDMYSLYTPLISICFIFLCNFFFQLKITLSILFYFLMISMGTLAGLYQFQNLTFNFANALWLPMVPIVFIETLIHSSFFSYRSRWQYNRIIISLIMSLSILYFYPIQTYVFLIIRNSLMYQSLLTLMVINVFIPACHSLMLTRTSSETNQNSNTIQLTTSSIDCNQSLTNQLESETTSVKFIKITQDPL